MLEIVCLIGIFYGLWKLGKFFEDLRDGLVDLDRRLTKLEKDAVKITFKNDVDNVVVHPEVKNKPDNPYWKKPGTKTTPKVMGEWQTKNKTKEVYKHKPLTEGKYKSQIKINTEPTKATAPPPPPLPARKPKNYNK